MIMAMTEIHSHEDVCQSWYKQKLKWLIGKGIHNKIRWRHWLSVELLLTTGLERLFSAQHWESILCARPETPQWNSPRSIPGQVLKPQRERISPWQTWQMSIGLAHWVKQTAWVWIYLKVIPHASYMGLSRYKTCCNSLIWQRFYTGQPSWCNPKEYMFQNKYYLTQ